MVRVNAGTVHLMAGERSAGRARRSKAALAIDPDVARAHNSLGVIAAREGRMPDAIEHWKRAAALDPRDYQTLFNLGSTLRGRGARRRRGPTSRPTCAWPRARRRRGTSRACARGWRSRRRRRT